jgi:hypothetical protein
LKVSIERVVSAADNELGAAIAAAREHKRVRIWVFFMLGEEYSRDGFSSRIFLLG